VRGNVPRWELCFGPDSRLVDRGDYNVDIRHVPDSIDRRVGGLYRRG